MIAYAAKSGARAIYLVHGEQEPRESLAEALRSQLGVHVGLPKRGDAVELLQ